MFTADTQDLLLDLKHDLGKYLCLPLAMLPADSSTEDVRQALFKALHQTRSDRNGIKSAIEIWDAFLQEAEAEPALMAHPRFAPMAEAVDAAFAMSRLLDDESSDAAAHGAFLHRDSLLKVMQNVSDQIMTLIEEVSRD